MGHTRDILVQARKFVDEGWIQGRMKATIEGKTHYCANGALVEAVLLAIGKELGFNSPWKVEDIESVFEPAEKSLQQAMGSNSIMLVNDYPDMTKDKILAFYDKAIDSIDKEK